MEETNSPSVAHVGYDISPLSRVKFKILLSWVEKYRNPRATEGESIYIYMHIDHISDVMVSVLASSAVDHGDYVFGICCFFAKHISLRSKNKDWLPQISIMCFSGATCLYIFRLLCQWDNTI
jgi:hypothetical protein